MAGQDFFGNQADIAYDLATYKKEIKDEKV